MPAQIEAAMTTHLLSSQELRAAQSRARFLSDQKLNVALIFRNSLHMFVENITRTIAARPVREFLCVDTTEVFAWKSPNEAAAKAF